MKKITITLGAIGATFIMSFSGKEIFNQTENTIDSYSIRKAIWNDRDVSSDFKSFSLEMRQNKITDVNIDFNLTGNHFYISEKEAVALNKNRLSLKFPEDEFSLNFEVKRLNDKLMLLTENTSGAELVLEKMN